VSAGKASGQWHDAAIATLESVFDRWWRRREFGDRSTAEQLA